MKCEQREWEGGGFREVAGTTGRVARPQVVLVFGDTPLVRRAELLRQLRDRYRGALLLGCSTAGEISGTEVREGTLAITAIELEHSQARSAAAKLADCGSSFDLGMRLATSIPSEGLTHAVVLAGGLQVNGSELVRGLKRGLPADVNVTGGLAGDGARFEESWLVFGEEAISGAAAILGLYGDRLRIGFGSLGGWDSFGPERVITRSNGNVLHELDGQSALVLYKKYLGDAAKGLPATALLFPLSVRIGEGAPLVRTILSIDEREQTMTFAGDVPEGALARLMKANFDRLIDGAVAAARTSYEALGSAPADLGLLISCVGRKLVLKQRVEEEVEGVREVLGPHPALTGFYSYGEIAPFTSSTKCELHNQTMTITTLSER